MRCGWPVRAPRASGIPYQGSRPEAMAFQGCLDHDHGHCQYGCLECIRGLVCHSCNTGPLCDEALADGYRDDSKTGAYLRMRTDWLPRYLNRNVETAA